MLDTLLVAQSRGTIILAVIVTSLYCRAFHHFPLFRAVDSVDVDGSSSDDL